MSRFIGKRGEDQVDRYLRQKGWVIKQRNYFARVGEIDSIAVDRHGYIVFIEVKFYSQQSYTHPLESITTAKQAKLKKAAEKYLYDHQLMDQDCRFDVITVTRETSQISHFYNVL